MPHPILWNVALLAMLLSVSSTGRAWPEEGVDAARFVVVNIIPGEEHGLNFEQVSHLRDGAREHDIRIGIGAIFSYLAKPRAEVEHELNGFLALAVRYNIPVVVQLDGEQWWEGRPDLWNWWDPGRPGYDPGNRMNVEWSGWDSSKALKLAWRNWGSQLRVLPPPNLMSQRYRAACHEEMKVFVPIILNWWKGLPRDKKHLLIGIKLGWESSIGVNAFTIPDGNTFLNRPEKDDPQIVLKAELVPDRGVVAIGYASVTAAGLAQAGALHEAHLAEIVRRHLEDLCGLAASLGVPREKMFTHVGGWKEEELLYDAALNQYSCPGWSFYRHGADATKDKGVERVLRRSDAPYWAAVEWLLMGEHTDAEWYDALMKALTMPKCRYVCIYNWSGIRNDKGAVEGIRRVMGETGVR